MLTFFWQHGAKVRWVKTDLFSKKFFLKKIHKIKESESHREPILLLLKYLKIPICDRINIHTSSLVHSTTRSIDRSNKYQDFRAVLSTDDVLQCLQLF